MPYELPELKYAYSALEPFIDSATMEIHHTKHHGSYVEKLNTALDGLSQYQNYPVEKLLLEIDSLPDDRQKQVQDNGGGHANHSLFWEIMAPEKNTKPSGEFEKLFNETFTDYETFKEKFTGEAMGRFGSGWVWLVLNSKNLEIYSTANQDSPLMQGHVPVLGLDVWEHAYYLKYQNKRKDYISAWWNVVNWEAVSRKYSEAVA